MDTIIIGGGISGLYMAYKLIKENPNRCITILEKLDRLGGRIYTDPSTHFEGGAGRFHNKNKFLIGLLRTFDLYDKAIEISDDFKIIDIAKPCLRQTSSMDLILEKLLDSKTETKSELLSMKFSQYLKKHLSKSEVQYIYDFFGYSSEVRVMNAFISLEILESYFMKKVQYYALRGGYSQLVDKLEKYLRQHNVRIMKKKEVQSIDYDESTKTTIIMVKDQQKQYVCDRCVLAVTKDVIAQIPMFSFLKPLLKKIELKPLCRIYMKFSNIDWYGDFEKITINNPLRYIIPINKQQKTIMVSYTDDIYAVYWKQIFDKHGYHGLTSAIMTLLKQTFCQDIDDPITTHIYYWDKGVAFYKENFDNKKDTKKIMKPFNNREIYICGENYSENNIAWVEGALESANYVLSVM